jgi:methylenetetrahydrofolate dehydrogenase (NADP+) / methenyltetrahydrofolate cyclohydrolase
MAVLMDGRALAEQSRSETARELDELGRLGLATVLVGDDPASQIYIRLKHEAATAVGIEAIDRRLPADVSEDELLELVAALNADDGIDGVLVQLPLPDHIDEARVIRAVDPVKDVDGYHPFNAGHLYLGRPTHVPATPRGILALLDEYRIPLAGARAVVVGRSQIVGKPVAMLLMHQNATVTICHSRTEDLARHTLDADILVAAVGHAALIAPDMVKQGATVVDVGMNRTDAGLTGDVDRGVAEVAAYLTPVPGGVGPMTVAFLLANTVRAARYRRGLLAFPQSEGYVWRA